MTREFWDQRFGGEDYVYGTAPNAFLRVQAERLAPGARVLLPGDGEGRNGVWLAERGMEVLSVDASPVGLGKAQRLAAARGVRIATECADLTLWRWPEAAFDAVAAMFLHLPPDARATVHRRIVAALRPGGTVILEAFRPAQLGYASGGPKDVAMLYTPEQLTADFAGLDVRLCEEALVDLDEGTFHAGVAATLRFVGVKPEA
ncbi:putative Tellurite resistance protein TehB [uncultured Alphaproteobacteria bacterium]|uniref:Putative Tellurite resistance protein TehB n=1 Tax=uncultured Alphaproteobacteria bacterium TaxID=91750 RepID=A0A212JK07_9PROT|nr:putative Tellurite resistance protein TehB [uncultured Alphaproteobacteria bacterium]